MCLWLPVVARLGLVIIGCFLAISCLHLLFCLSCLVLGSLLVSLCSLGLLVLRLGCCLLVLVVVMVGEILVIIVFFVMIRGIIVRWLLTQGIMLLKRRYLWCWCCQGWWKPAPVSHNIGGSSTSAAFLNHWLVSKVLEVATLRLNSVFKSFYFKDVQFILDKRHLLGLFVAAGEVLGQHILQQFVSYQIIGIMMCMGWYVSDVLVFPAWSICGDGD